MIRWMLWGRQWGKSHQTLAWFKEDPEHRVIICPNLVQAEQLRREVEYIPSVFATGSYRDLEKFRELLKKNIVGYAQWRTEFNDHKRTSPSGEWFIPEVAIDNLDMMIRSLVGADVKVITATGVNDSPKGLRIDPQTLKYPTVD